VLSRNEPVTLILLLCNNSLKYETLFHVLRFSERAAFGSSRLVSITHFDAPIVSHFAFNPAVRSSAQLDMFHPAATLHLGSSSGND
jgi:hypothetical protein